MSEESTPTPTPEVPVSAEKSALDVMTEQVHTLSKQVLTLTSERDEFRDALTEVAAERDTLKTAPDASARIAELEGTIRDRTHFDKFAELAKGAKAKDAALKHLWQVSGYKAEADDIDERALQTLVAKLKQDADYAFDPEPSSNVTAAQEAARPTSRTKYGLDIGSAAEPAGGGRASRNQGADGTIVTQEMRADPKFMLDPKNRELIRDAAIGGRFR
jgi:hypothetical protein